MITVDDLLFLPYTPDLTRGGIAFACRTLPHSSIRAGGSALDQLRRTVASAAAELAFRRYLVQLDVPFGVKKATPFADPDRYDVQLGGHRCAIESCLISHRNQAASFRENLSLALKAPALVPLDEFRADGQAPNDLLLFAFLTGLIATTPQQVQKALESGQRVYLIHPMPKDWCRPRAWIPLAPLVLKSESKEALSIEIGGQDAGRRFLVRSVELPSRTRVLVGDDFHSVTYLHVHGPPGGRVGIHSPVRGETYVIQPHHWGNIWVQGTAIWLLGWITREEFHRRAHLIPEGSRVFQYTKTRTKNLGVAVSELKPLDELLEKVRAWKSSR